ncbi:synaptotagmin-like protein 2 isoform X2 [Melanotaenia boesemani]|nr:synaptotagmin-like protein 2 isoform X2 [Melanotaenia boesemani]
MIDLSHLTEEEQGVIMTVLRRDAELKKAEEERLKKLEKVLNSSTQSDVKLKYLTGEWFYEAKSRRHNDKIHGSEIILASMKQGKAASLDGSLRIDRSKSPSSRGSDIVAPLKPARCSEAPQPQEINDTEKENRFLAVRSPRMPRQNPFNRASLIVVEPPEYNHDFSTSQDQEPQETEPTSPLKNAPEVESSLTVGGSITSECSSVGFRPVPKKRTFLSRHTVSHLDSNGQLGLNTQVRPVVPAPRRSLQKRSTVSSDQPFLKNTDETPQKSASNQLNQSVQPTKSADENSLQQLCDAVSSNPSLERERNQPFIASDGLATYTRTDVSAEIEAPQRCEDLDDQTQREHTASNCLSKPSSNIQEKENNSSMRSAVRQEELSLPQSTVDPDPPLSYDLNFIDKSDQQTQRSNHKHVFKLSPQTTSPTGEDEEESIVKVLDWFNRSTDSSDWLNTEDGPKATKRSDRRHAVCKLQDEDSLARDGISDRRTSDRERETLEAKMSHVHKQNNEDKKLRAVHRKGSRELTETQEEARIDTRERTHSQDVKDNTDESQPLKISHLKSFWEKSNTGPKILISKSATPGDKGPNPAHLSAEKGADIPSVPGIYSEKGTHDKFTSNPNDEREQQLVISPQINMGGSVYINNHQQAENVMINSTQMNKSDSAYSKLLFSPQKVDRGVSDSETLCVSRLSSPERTAIDPVSESASVVKPKLQPDGISESGELILQELLSATIPVTQQDTDQHTRVSSDSEKLSLTRNNPHMDFKPGGNYAQITTKAQICRVSSEEMKRRDSEDNSMHSSMSPKRKEEVSNKDKTNSPHLNSQGHQDSTAERIKQLKSFWEQERNKPVFYTGKPKAYGEGKFARGANLAKLNKRFTKSEFDLSLIGNESCSDEEDHKNHPNFTILPLNQRLDKLSPSLGTSRTQFNTLREFWDDATSDSRVSLTFDKPKSPKRKEPVGAQLSFVELKGVDSEISRLNPAVEKTRAAVMKSCPQNRSKSPHDRQTGSGSRPLSDSKNILPTYMSVESGPARQSRRSSKDGNREEKFTKPQNNSGKESRAPKNKKDSFSITSSRGNSLRRATSMFSLSVADEKDPNQLRMDVNPVHSQSRKHRQSIDKGSLSKRSSEDSETVAPRARAFVPTDYRHYLGMTDSTSIHTSLAPAVKDEGTEVKTGFDLDLSGPVRSSTPVNSEERHSRKSNKINQRPVWANYSQSDTGQESSISSTSETWPNSRNSSNREIDDDDDQNPVRKALRRAETRPKNLAKSLEDITASITPRQERRPDPTADLRRSSDVSAITSPSSALFSSPDHLKKMSKSVPSFLQNENAGEDADSTCEHRYQQGRLMAGSSVTNLSSSSGMASMSSLSGSVMTMYSGDFVEVQGNIQFSINYIQRLREFHIFVAECRGLAAVDPKRSRSDPYVKSYLVPDKANLGKRKTSVKKKTLNPTFNEILRYRVRMEYLRTQMLILSVWHHDTFGRNSFLGEVDVDLSKWDFDHTQMNFLALKARTIPTVEPSNGRGEMRLAIRFLPQITHSEGVAKEVSSTGEIHIWVKECKNLPLIRATIDPYVKCFVLPDTSRKSRQKTRVLRRTADPVFNHTMVYDGISEADLTEACVELTVWDRDRLASNLLGGLRLGSGTGRSYGALVDWMDSGPYEVALWERMMASPNEWVEDVLPLRMLNSAKAAFK